MESMVEISIGIHCNLEPASVLCHDLYATYLQCIRAENNAMRKENNSLICVRTGKAVAILVGVNSHTRSIQPQNTECQTQNGDADVDNEEADLTGTGEPLAIVEMQPIDTGKTVTEPGSEKSTDHAVQVTEDGNSFADNPGDDPANNTESDPEAD